MHCGVRNWGTKVFLRAEVLRNELSHMLPSPEWQHFLQPPAKRNEKEAFSITHRLGGRCALRGKAFGKRTFLMGRSSPS